MVPAGLMTGRRRADRSCSTATPPTATGRGITVEPEGGSDAPTTEPIALFDLEKAT